MNKRLEKGLGVDYPVAQLLNQYFTVSTPKRVIDDSPGDDEGEIDHLGRDAAIEYLLMPERLKKVEHQLDFLGEKLKEVMVNLHEVTTGLSKLLNTKFSD